MCLASADAPNATNCSFSGGTEAVGGGGGHDNNYWALLALALVAATAAGNILVCLAISWERRLQNVTNYFLMSLAITDLMVAVLVMPLGILTLVTGFFPLPSEYCLAWVCLDVLLCTASIMHLCTISVDRFLSLRYPMRFGRNKTRRRVVLKIIFVWLLSIAMSMPLSLMYSKDHSSVLVDGTCQIPDPLYKLIGSIVCFYIPLLVMLITYALTVRLLQVQQRNLGLATTSATAPPLESQWGSTWYSSSGSAVAGGGGTSTAATTRSARRAARKTHSASSANDTEVASTSALTSQPPPAAGTLDPGHLWLQDAPIAAPMTVTALHRFGADMMRLSEGMAPTPPAPQTPCSCRRQVVTWTEKRGARTVSTVATSATPMSAAAASTLAGRTSSRHGRILMLEQKATKVLGVVFFTFVILWSPFFVLNLVPALCDTCDLSPALVDLVTWLGYASSMVNPIFYTVFNKVFRQAFKKVLLCRYRNAV